MVETEYEKGIAVAKVSPSYYSQIESGKGIRPEKITIEMLWSIGLVLKVDPLELFVRKYPDLPQKYLLKSERDKLFI
jgi:transcriptional regulator with XRE-family HTH domain